MAWSRIGAGLVLAAGALSCSGGSSGGVFPDEDPSTLLAASFAPDQPTPPASSVALAEGSRSGDTVTVRVNVTGVNDVFGASFQLLFDASRAAYVGRSPGTLLEQGGQSVTYLTGSCGTGCLEVGASRNGGSGVDVGTTRTLVQLTFRALQAGNSALSFAAGAALLDDQAPEPRPITAVSPWAGGSIQAQ